MKNIYIGSYIFSFNYLVVIIGYFFFEIIKVYIKNL